MQKIANPQQNQGVQRFFCFVTVKDGIILDSSGNHKDRIPALLHPVHTLLLFTDNIPRGVFCERRSQKTRDISREFMRSA